MWECKRQHFETDVTAMCIPELISKEAHVICLTKMSGKLGGIRHPSGTLELKHSLMAEYLSENIISHCHR